MSDDAAPVADTLSQIDLDVLAAKLAEKLKQPIVTPEYQLIGFTIVGKELRATVKTPNSKVFQGVVTDWKEVTVVEVPK